MRVRSNEWCLRRGIELNSNSALAEIRYANYLMIRARTEEVIAHMRKAVELGYPALNRTTPSGAISMARASAASASSCRPRSSLRKTIEDPVRVVREQLAGDMPCNRRDGAVGCLRLD
jgi:hypothetical protein